MASGNPVAHFLKVVKIGIVQDTISKQGVYLPNKVNPTLLKKFWCPLSHRDYSRVAALFISE